MSNADMWLGWLNAELSRRFEVCMGPKRAYFEIPCGEWKGNPIHNPVIARVTYVVWGAQIHEFDAERHLAGILLLRIDELIRHYSICSSSLLFLRRPIDIIPGEDGRSRISMRFAIPGYDCIRRGSGADYNFWPLYVPDGGEYPKVSV